MKRAVLLLFVLQSICTTASTITIGIFMDQKPNALALTLESGNYVIVLDSAQRLAADPTAVYFFSLENDSLRMRTKDTEFGKFKRIDFLGDAAAAVKMKTIAPAMAGRRFDNDLSFFIQDHQLKVRNRLDLEKYVAGVVEVEAGPAQTPEYYKVQTIICRTYGLSNLRRHEVEHFNLCDNVHCQAYKGYNHLNAAIEEAAFTTKNLVLVDNKSELITTAFHSNCGGETCNSEDVWGLKKSYLRSTKDTFCLRQRNAHWTKMVAKKQWWEYLSQNCKPCAQDSSELCCDFTQDNRKLYLEVDSTPIPLKNIRNELKLKSAFFSIQVQNDSLLFVGKGYGHGVGLCQEGAIQMAKQGLKYGYILHYYYKDIDIINLNQLHFFKE